MDFKSVVEELKKTADDLLAKTDIDEKAVAKFNDLKGQAEAYLAKSDVDDQLKEKVNGILEKTDLDEKLKAKSQELLDKTDIDEKVAGKVGEIKDVLNKQSYFEINAKKPQTFASAALCYFDTDKRKMEQTDRPACEDIEDEFDQLYVEFIPDLPER